MTLYVLESATLGQLLDICRGYLKDIEGLPSASKVFVFAMSISISALYAQAVQYQKANVPIVARTLKATALLKDSISDSRVVARLEQGEKVEILGRKGIWYDIRLSPARGSLRGWLTNDSIRVLGAKSSARVEPSPTPTPAVAAAPLTTAMETPPSLEGGKPRETTAQKRPANPYRLIPIFGLGLGARHVPNQIRAGAAFLYLFRPSVYAGLNAEIGFRKATLFSVGPEFGHTLFWPRWSSARIGAFGGFPFVHVSSGGFSQQYFGVRFGAEISTSAFRLSGASTDLLLRLGPEILLFGTRTVPISFVTMAGVAFRF